MNSAFKDGGVEAAAFLRGKSEAEAAKKKTTIPLGPGSPPLWWWREKRGRKTPRGAPGNSGRMAQVGAGPVGSGGAR